MKNKWVLKTCILTFLLAILFSMVSNFLGDFNNIILIICILTIIIIGIIFDTIGTAILSCDVKVLHSKASQKLKGAKEAIKLAKNASQVSNFCSDVIGDICGIVSGSLITILVVRIVSENNISIWNIILSSCLSAFTVGGKAIGKTLALKKGNDIIHFVGIIFSFFKNKKKKS